MNQTGNWTVIATATDAHTSEFIKDYNIESSSSGRIDFETDIDMTGEGDYKNVSVIFNGGDVSIKNVKIQKNDDRYNFNYEFFTADKKPTDEMTISFRVECPGLDRVKSKYKGHIVCWESRNWIDFEDEYNNMKIIKEKKCGIDCYDFTMQGTVKDSLKFNSFGELNYVSETSTFEVTTTSPVNYTLRWLDCPEDEVNLKQVIWILGIFIVVMLAGFIGKTGTMCILSMFGLIGIGFVYIACFEIIGAICIMFGLFSGVYGVYLIAVKNKW